MWFGRSSSGFEVCHYLKPRLNCGRVAFESIGIDSAGGINYDKRIKFYVMKFRRNFSILVKIYWLKRRIFSIPLVGEIKLQIYNSVLWYQFQRTDKILRRMVPNHITNTCVHSRSSYRKCCETSADPQSLPNREKERAQEINIPKRCAKRERPNRSVVKTNNHVHLARQNDTQRQLHFQNCVLYVFVKWLLCNFYSVARNSKIISPCNFTLIGWPSYNENKNEI